MKEQDARREQMERENRERQAERDREQSERKYDAEDDMPITDEFIDDLAQSEQPQVRSMLMSDDKLGLIETPEARMRQRKNLTTIKNWCSHVVNL